MSEMFKKAQYMIQNNQIPDNIKNLINNLQNSNTSNSSNNSNNFNNSGYSQNTKKVNILILIIMHKIITINQTNKIQIILSQI